MNAVNRYSRVAVVLHWLIAAFILFNLAFGFLLEDLPPRWKWVILPLHLSAGMSVLVLSGLRVVWRLLHAPPEHVSPLRPLEAKASQLAHFLLYAGMVLMPLTGWAILSAHPAPGTEGYAAERAQFAQLPPDKQPPPGGGLKVWSVIPLPAIGVIERVGDTAGGLVAQDMLHDEFVGWHAVGAWTLILLLLAHVAGALKHQFIDRQPSLQRMSLRR